MVACTGSEFCRFAVVETKERAVKWARCLDAQLAGEPVERRRPGRLRPARMPASSACTSRVARPRAPSPRSPTSASAATSPTWASTSTRRSTSAWAGRSVPTPPSSTGSRTPVPVDDVPDALLRVVAPLPGRAPCRTSPSTTGPAGPHDDLRRRLPRTTRGAGIAGERSAREALPDPRGDERDRRAARARSGSGSSRPASSTPTAASSAAPASRSARRTPSASTRTPTCPSWSRCAPAARCAGTSAPGAACATRRCGRRRPTADAARRDVRPAQVRRTRPTPTGRSPVGRPATGSARWSTATRCGPAAQLDDAQDGGAVTRAADRRCWPAGEIDGALVSKPSADPDEPWKGVATIATTAEEIRAAAGSFYNQTMALAELDLVALRPAGQAAPRRGRARRARSRASGPCRRGAGRPVRTGSTPSSSPSPCCAPRASTTRRSCSASCATSEASTSTGSRKIDVIRGRMIVEYRDGELAVDEPVKDFHGAALKGCDECADFLGRCGRHLGRAASAPWTAGRACSSAPSGVGWPSRRPGPSSTSASLDDPAALLQSRRAGQEDRQPDPAAQARPRRPAVHRLRRARRRLRGHRPGPGREGPLSLAVGYYRRSEAGCLHHARPGSLYRPQRILTRVRGSG